ncbi:MAG TPA: signal peptide peptidase SppA [Polyangiaceae bacterium]|nr:signal peptide peptidase SppA [Polyangiaceae bacterium]
MILLRLLWFVIRLAFLPWVALIIWLRRRVRPGSFVMVEVDGFVSDFPAPRRAPFLLSGLKPLSVASLHELADVLPKEPRVRGVFVVLRGFRAGMATATSVRRALLRLREGGREVVAYLPQGGDTKDLYIASAASRVYAAPHATLAPVGFASSARYAKRALDKVGIEAQRLAAGAYKSAGETLDRDSMSEGQREQIDAVLDGFYGELVAALASGRRVDEARAKALIDGAPYQPAAAVEAGLVDGVAYEDELPSLLGTRERPAPVVRMERFLRARRARLLPTLRRPPVLAVLPLHGAIMSGTGALAMDERFVGAVRTLRMSRRVRGVLLHVDSPGGGALASDRIHHELVQLAREKPVVACFANVAASGGYYAAAAAHHIVAEPTTITGSIGVVAARLVIEPLLSRLGIVTETLKRGARAALLDPLHPIDTDERKVLEGEVQSFYDAFVDVVATGRKRSREQIHAVAQGRVWTGKDAADRGLVDELGDARTAVDALRSRVGPAAARMPLMMTRLPLAKVPPLAPAREPSLLATVLELLDLDLSSLSLARSGERVLAFSWLAEKLR